MKNEVDKICNLIILCQGKDTGIWNIWGDYIENKSCFNGTLQQQPYMIKLINYLMMKKTNITKLFMPNGSKFRITDYVTQNTSSINSWVIGVTVETLKI
jgi:hypothetical protein